MNLTVSEIGSGHVLQHVDSLEFRGDLLPALFNCYIILGRTGAMVMRKSSHVQYDIEYHIVWTTKYRYKVLNGKVAERARVLIRQCCNSMNVTIIKGLIGKEHVHLLVSCPPSLSVSKLVQQLKR